jgi:protein-disulfide isomerase
MGIPMRHNAFSKFSISCILFLWASMTGAAWAEDLGRIGADAQAAMRRDPGTPRVGSSNPDVIVVEYFDYNCPFCKQLNPALQGLLKADPKVALIYKDWPIFGGVSKYAAGLALAAERQGKYIAAHDVLMNATRLASNAQVDALLAGAGLDMTALKKDRATHNAEIEALLLRNDKEVRALGIRGTPGLFIGGHIVNGVYDVQGLERAAAAARRDRN